MYRTLHNLLTATDAMIMRSAMRVPGYEMPIPFRVELNALRARQAFLKRELEAFRRRQAGDPNLGLAPLVIAAGAGVVVALSTIGGWVLSNFTKSKELDTQTQIYQDMRAEGTDSKRAAEIVFGGNTDWGSVMSKGLILAAVLAGVYVVSKVWR